MLLKKDRHVIKGVECFGRSVGTHKKGKLEYFERSGERKMRGRSKVGQRDGVLKRRIDML